MNNLKNPINLVCSTVEDTSGATTKLSVDGIIVCVAVAWPDRSRCPRLLCPHNMDLTDSIPRLVARRLALVAMLGIACVRCIGSTVGLLASIFVGPARQRVVVALAVCVRARALAVYWTRGRVIARRSAGEDLVEGSDVLLGSVNVGTFLDNDHSGIGIGG